MKFKNRQVLAFFRPFEKNRTNVISKDNKIVGAFIYDSNNKISLNNHLLKTYFFSKKVKEESK